MSESKKDMLQALKGLLDSQTDDSYQKLQDFFTAYAVFLTDEDFGYVAKIITNMAEMIHACKETTK